MIIINLFRCGHFTRPTNGSDAKEEAPLGIILGGLPPALGLRCRQSLFDGLRLVVLEIKFD